MGRKEVIFGLTIALIFAVFISPFASPFPDGLEKVAEDKGFIDKGEEPLLTMAPIPDYVWPGITSEAVAASIAGMAGTFITFAAAWGLALLIKRP